MNRAAMQRAGDGKPRGATLAYNTYLASFGDIVSRRFGVELLFWDLLDRVTSHGVASILLAPIYRYGPGAPVRWRDAAVGAVTALALFASSKTVVRYYVATRSSI